MSAYRRMFVVSENPLQVILLDHVVQYRTAQYMAIGHELGSNGKDYVVVYLSNGETVQLRIERLKEFQIALYDK